MSLPRTDSMNQRINSLSIYEDLYQNAVTHSPIHGKLATPEFVPAKQLVAGQELVIARIF
jgi:hypothetical protein